ncbi:MAG: squalene/phytoene synthase family protein [Steroidobacteraceae bacterium]
MPATPDLPRTRYFAWLYSPAPQRVLLQALFGIEREIGGSLRPGLDHHVAHSRLQWWREECERCAAGRPVHPLTRELVAALTKVPGPPSHEPTAQPPERSLRPLSALVGLVDTAVWDLAGATFESRRELTAYCERWSGAMIEPMAALTTLRASTRTPTQYPDRDRGGAGRDWRALGAALRELELLTDLAREADAGRLRVPLDELELIGEHPGALARRPWPGAVAQLLTDRHEALRAAVARNLGDLDRPTQLALRGVLVWIALAWRLSRRAQHELPHNIQPRRLDTICDAWSAWRAARWATTGRFRLE